MKKKKLAGIAAITAAMIMSVTFVPPQYADVCSIAVTASAAETSEYLYNLPNRIYGNIYSSTKVSAAGSGKLKISWNGSNDKTYGIYLNSEEKAAAIVKGTSTILTGLTNGENYNISIMEVEKTSDGYEKKLSVGWAIDSPTSMKKISGMKKKNGVGKVELKWNAVSGADKYAVYIGEKLYKTVRTPYVKITGCPGSRTDIVVVPVKNGSTNNEYGIHTKLKVVFKTSGAVTGVKYKDDSDSLKYKGADIFEFNGSYPVLTMKNSKAADKINSRIKNVVYTDELAAWFDMNTDAKQEWYDIIKDHGFMGCNEEKTECNIAACTKNYISIKCYDYFYSFGAAHGYYSETYLNFDAETGNAIKFSDVFNEDKFIKKCRPIMAEKITKLRGMETGEEYLYISDNNWHYSDGKLIITYQPYDIGSYAEGIITVELTYNEIKDCLTDYGKTVIEK